MTRYLINEIILSHKNLSCMNRIFDRLESIVNGHE